MLIETLDHTTLLGNSTVFTYKYNPALIHQVVNCYVAIGHDGTKKQKDRAEVSGGNSKPWPQKGRGLARTGSTRTPIFRKGGVTFAFSGAPRRKIKINSRMYRQSLKSLLTHKLESNLLFFISPLTVDSHKTKDFVDKYGNVDQNTLFILHPDNITENLLLATRNVPHFTITTPRFINPVELLSHSLIYVSADVITDLEEKLQ